MPEWVLGINKPVKGKLLLHALGESLLGAEGGDPVGEGQASGEVSVMGSFTQSLPRFPAGRPAMILHFRALLGDNPHCHQPQPLHCPLTKGTDWGKR